MFATYLLNSPHICLIRRRPNLHVKSEHLANIPRILVSHIRLCLPSNRRVFTSCSQKLFAAVHFFRKGNLKINSQTIKENAYKSIVRPKPEYCSTVWDPKCILKNPKKAKYKTQASISVRDASEEGSKVGNRKVP